MRIALVSPYSLEVFGGVQGQVAGLAAVLAQSDEVMIVAPGHDGTRGAVVLVGVGASTAVPVNGSRAPIALGPAAWHRCRVALSRFRPDVLHVHEPFVPLTGPAALRSDVAPIVATFHRAGSGVVYRRLGALLAPLAARVAVRVAVSEEAAATLTSVLGRRTGTIEILPNAVDLSRFRAGTRSRSTRPVVAFVGRHERRKGLEVLLEAFAELGGEAVLEVIGTGPEEARLKGRYAGASNVAFLGALDDTEMASRLASADLLVAPSLGGESFGVVLLEAMAVGTAVIASDLPGYRLAAGDAARFVPPGDATALREAIGALLWAPEQRAELVRRGLLRVADFSFERLAEHYRVLYAVALERHERPPSSTP